MRHVLRQVTLKEGEGFDFIEDEDKIISCEWDHPYFHLVIMMKDDEADRGP